MAFLLASRCAADVGVGTKLVSTTTGVTRLGGARALSRIVRCYLIRPPMPSIVSGAGFRIGKGGGGRCCGGSSPRPQVRPRVGPRVGPRVELHVPRLN